jgi:hypothetical protein
VASQPKTLKQRNARENTGSPDYAKHARTKYLHQAVMMAKRKDYKAPCPELEARVYTVLKQEQLPLLYSDFRSGTMFDRLDLKFWAKPAIVLKVLRHLVKQGRIVAYYDEGKRDYKKLVFIADTEWKKLLREDAKYALWRCFDIDKAAVNIPFCTLYKPTEDALDCLYKHTGQTPNDTSRDRV